jgi:hypothetical protein
VQNYNQRRIYFLVRVSGRCRKCWSWVRVRKFEQDPFNFIGLPQGSRMPCKWGCGAELTECQMRAHLTIRCEAAGRLRPWRPRREERESYWVDAHRAAQAMWLAPRSATHGEPDAQAFHQVIADALQSGFRYRPWGFR